MKAVLKAILKEGFYVITYPFLSLFYRPPQISNDHPKGTILLVETWFQQNPYHKMWSSYLERKGFHTILINFPDMNENFSTTAKKLEAFIQEHHLQNFTLVGISTGALVCLYYLHYYNGWKNIKYFISVGGPIRGSWSALFISFTKKGRDLLPGSKFIRHLLRVPIPPKKMISLLAQQDEFVPVASSAVPGSISYIIPVIGHNFFHLDHKKTYDLIAELADN